MDDTRITTEPEYERALEEAERLMDAQEGMAEGVRLAALFEVIEAYEALRLPIGSPDS